MPLPIRTLALALVLAAGLLLARAQPCAACSCAEEPAPPGGWTREALVDDYDVVFRGHVVDAGELADLGNGLTDGSYLVRMTVDEAWKGIAPGASTVVVSAGHGGGDCTIPFAVGGAWLIYGYHDSERAQVVATSICDRTAFLGSPWRVAAAPGDLATLGDGVRQAPPELLAPGSPLVLAQAALWRVTQPLGGDLLPWGWWAWWSGAGG